MTTDLYVENGVGRRVTEAINLFTSNHGITAHFQFDVHPSMQQKQHGDEWWIADITARGMAILTQDRAILRDGPERETVIATGAKLIALRRAGYSTWDKLRCVTAQWPTIERLLRDDGPAAVVISVSSAEAEHLRS